MSASRNRNMTTAMQARFLELLPAIRQVASYAFRRLSGDRREELIAEVVAHAFARLVELGKAEVAFGTVLGHFAVRRVHSGHFVGQPWRTCDALSKYAQRTRGFAVQSMHMRLGEGKWQDLVIEDRRSTPAELAVIRLDFAAWIAQLDRNKRAVALRLAHGDGTFEAAQNCQLTPGRISQLRGELKRSWSDFQGETLAVAAGYR